MTFPNIAIVSNLPFIPTRGGIQRVSDTLCRMLVERGYKVYTFHLHKPDVTFTPQVPATYSETPDTADVRNSEAYRDFLVGNRIDLIINQDGQWDTSFFFLDPRCVPGHIKTISFVHSVPMREYNHLLRFLWMEVRYGNGCTLKERVRILARLILYSRTKKRFRQRFACIYSYLRERGSKVVFLSPHFVEEAEREGLVAPGSAAAIPNANTYDEAVIPATLRKEKVALYVGRLENGAKQVALLLDIWRRVSRDCADWKLVIVGEGPDEGLLRDCARRHKLRNVEFAGRQDPRPYYERASILCLTSLFEGFGMVLTEAQQFGVVPIAFDSYASVHSIITPGENGELAASFSKKEYAQKLLHLMQDAPYRERLAAKARETVRQFAPERIAEMWDKLIQSL